MRFSDEVSNVGTVGTHQRKTKDADDYAFDFRRNIGHIAAVTSSLFDTRSEEWTWNGHFPFLLFRSLAGLLQAGYRHSQNRRQHKAYFIDSHWSHEGFRHQVEAWPTE
jgi:hypothetical protein